MDKADNCTVFGLIRHSETLWNLEKRVQGHNNSSLSECGIKMAKSWGKILMGRGYDRILASDLGRTLKTAALINESLKIPVSENEGLREMDWGNWTGKSYRYVKKGTPDIMNYNDTQGWDFHPPGGENRRSVYARASDVLKKSSEIWPGEKILVVTHEGVIHCIINFLKSRKFLFSEPLLLRPFYIHELVCNKNGLSIVRLNAVSLN